METRSITLISIGGVVTNSRGSRQFIKILATYLKPIYSQRHRKLLDSQVPEGMHANKIKFGANYFIEELTRLKCINYAARLTFYILLCERRNLS